MRHIQNHILNVEWQHEVSSKASEAIYKPEEKQRLTLLYNCPKIHGVEIEAN